MDKLDLFILILQLLRVLALAMIVIQMNRITKSMKQVSSAESRQDNILEDREADTLEPDWGDYPIQADLVWRNQAAQLELEGRAEGALAVLLDELGRA